MRKKYPKRLLLSAKIHKIMDVAMDKSVSYTQFKINATNGLKYFMQNNYRRRIK